MNSSDKRFQVFISSTFRDLIEERKEVIQALLELDCIPSGMELFQAADDDQWTLIKRVIDDCDYYMVIIAGRYGSVSSRGISYTEMEYRYAIEQGKPVIAFLHQHPEKLPQDMCESDEDGKRKLSEFRDLAQNKMVKFWNNAHELGSVVSRSIVRLIKERPAVGWIRASAVSSDEANKEILRLRQKVDELEINIKRNSFNKPAGTDDLLQDNDSIPCVATVRFRKGENTKILKSSYNFEIEFNKIFGKISPRLLEETSENGIEGALDELFLEYLHPIIMEKQENADIRISGIESAHDCFQQIKVQLIALGLIVRGERKRAVSDSGNYWKLTPYGESRLIATQAMRKSE